METKQPLEKTQGRSSVSRALVYRWQIRFSEDSLVPLSLNKIRRHTVITVANKCDVKCVEFNTTWCWPDCEEYCTVKQYRSSICTSDINWTYVFDKWVQCNMKCIRVYDVYIEKEWRCHNRINAIVCDVRVLRIPPGDALLMSSAIGRV